MKYIVIVLAVFILFKQGIFSSGASYESGVKVAEYPVQKKIGASKSFLHKGYTITPLEEFSITAKVLAKKRYRSGREAELSPVDLALGWGPMSDGEVLKHINISQSNRWYHWNTKEFPIPRRDIETHSANMHMIPETASVESALLNASEGNIISLSGKLVSITAKDGWRWKSSLTRTDTGAGSCEVIWVESFEIKH